MLNIKKESSPAKINGLDVVNGYRCARDFLKLDIDQIPRYIQTLAPAAYSTRYSSVLLNDQQNFQNI
jgi:hypothetical protein